MSVIAGLVIELSHELPIDSRLKDLKFGWIHSVQPSVQSPFQKLNFGNSSQKTRRSRIILAVETPDIGIYSYH